MSLFGKKKEKIKDCCSESHCNEITTKETEAVKSAFKIEILGSGCAKCNTLEEAAKAALTELGMDIGIDHVSDFTKIAAYGVMTTPALVVNGKVVSYGKVLKKDEVKTLLLQASEQHRSKPRVAFICVHNSCRSQIAEALGKHLAADVFESYSAGTETKDQINPDAVRLMKKHYGIDMEQSQHPKLLTEIPAVDIVVTMGCNVSCPSLPCRHREDWGLDDPTGKEDEDFVRIIKTISEKVLTLKQTLESA